MSLLKSINFMGYKSITASFGKYHDGNTRLALYTDNEPLLIATVNTSKKEMESLSTILSIPRQRLVLIKDWSENKGIFKELVRAGYIEDLHLGITTGYCIANIAQLTDKAWEIKNR